MKFKATITLFLLVLTGVSPLAQDPPPPPPFSFLNTIAVGDSLAAGVQSGVLRSEGQIASFPALIARQAGTFMFLPLMPAPGVGREVTLVDGMPVVGPVTGGAASRGFPLIVPQHLAVPTQTTLDALTVRPDFSSSEIGVAFASLILGVPLVIPFGAPPVSQIELAVGLQPTFTILWLGSNEVLGAALAGDSSLATPLPVFQQSYTMAIGALLTFTQTRLVVANVPDVTVIAYLTPAEDIAAAAGAPLDVIGPILGIAAGDSVTAPGIPLVSAILMGEMAPPLPPNVVLTAAETAELQTLTAQMNGFIAALAAQLNFPVVDANGMLNEIDQNGFEVGGRTLTTDFLGGIFSLDGYHPTNTSQAITANAFIDAINSFYGRNIPPVDVAAVAARDPLIFGPGPAERDYPWIMPMSQEGHETLMKTLGFARPVSDGGDGPGNDPQLDRTREILDWSLSDFLAQFPVYNFFPGGSLQQVGEKDRSADFQPVVAPPSKR